MSKEYLLKQLDAAKAADPKLGWFGQICWVVERLRTLEDIKQFTVGYMQIDMEHGNTPYGVLENIKFVIERIDFNPQDERSILWRFFLRQTNENSLN